MKIFKLRSSTFNHLKALLHVLEYFIGEIQHNLCLPIIAHYGYRNIVETTHEYLQFASVKYPYTTQATAVTAHICSLILMRQVREQEICW